MDQDRKGLPGKVREITRAIVRESGMDLERAIPAAVNRVKTGRQGQQGAIRALAEWQALKARAAARRGGKGVAASQVMSAADARVLEPACRWVGR